MASKIGLSYRREAAQNRLAAATQALSERFALELGEIPTQDRDADALAVRQLEAMADHLEAVVTSTEPQEMEGVAVETDVAIRSAYAFYDSDNRVHGPDDFEAFSEAVTRALAGESFPDDPPPVEDEKPKGNTKAKGAKTATKDKG